MYNCPICNNEQWIIYTDKDGYECVKPCQCQKIRKSLKLAEESGKLKRHITDNDYDTLIDRYKNAEVLYIDDFWKNENSTEPTSADIKLANEILNYRYNKARATNSLCKTIISSERLMAQLIDFDSAIAGRLVEMSIGYLNEIKGAEKNYRLRNFV